MAHDTCVTVKADDTLRFNFVEPDFVKGGGINGTSRHQPLLTNYNVAIILLAKVLNDLIFVLLHPIRI